MEEFKLDDSHHHNPYVVPSYERKLVIAPAAFQEIRAGLEASHPDRLSILEIGCSHGHFMEQQFLRQAPWIYYGVDYKFKEVLKTDDKLIPIKDEGKGTGWILKAHAQKLNQYFTPGSLDGVIVQFPDPWPKLRHRKHRYLNKKFVNVVWEMLKPGGFFFFKTDVENYFQEVEPYVPGALWKSYRYDQCSWYDPELWTPFEKIFLRQKLPIYAFLAIKESVAE